MNRHFRFLFLIMLLIFYVDGLCSDSTYMCIRWNGPVDKPYHEFVFYKKGGYNPEQSLLPYGGNPFVLQIPLSEKQFEELKHVLFDKYHNPDSSDRSNPLFMSYYIGYFEGSNWISTNYMNNRNDFIVTFQDVVKYFKGTKYEADVKRKWKLIFNRIGIYSNK